LDAVFPCGLSRIARLYDPTTDNNYITAPVVYDLYDTSNVAGETQQHISRSQQQRRKTILTMNEDYCPELYTNT
jgi:hypothetical protein